MIRILGGILFALLALSLQSHAEGANRLLLVDAELLVEFRPEQAFVIFEQNMQVKTQPATLIPPIVNYPDSMPEGSARWLVGALVSHAGDQPFLYGFIVKGSNGEAASTALRLRDIGTRIDSFETAEALKSYISGEREILERDVNLQNVQEGELKRLQMDVDTIADIGRIVEVREDFMSKEGHLKRLDKDMANLNLALNQVAAYSQPRNFMKREAELNRQILELNMAAKRAEESARRQDKTKELTPQEKQEIVDSVKDLNEQALVQRLAVLKKYAAQLEEQAGIEIQR